MAVCEICECYVESSNRAWWMPVSMCVSCAPPEED